MRKASSLTAFSVRLDLTLTVNFYLTHCYTTIPSPLLLSYLERAKCLIGGRTISVMVRPTRSVQRKMEFGYDDVKWDAMPACKEWIAYRHEKDLKILRRILPSHIIIRVCQNL
jgi:hypothetical protein